MVLDGNNERKIRRFKLTVFNGPDQLSASTLTNTLHLAMASEPVSDSLKYPVNPSPGTHLLMSETFTKECASIPWNLGPASPF